MSELGHGEEQENQNRKDRNRRYYPRPMGLLRPNTPALNVDVEVGNYDERGNNQAGDQHARNYGREIMQQFLQPQEVPRGLGGIRSMHRIGDALQRSIGH